MIKEENLVHFKDKMMKERCQIVDEETSIMWNNISSCMKKVAREALEGSKDNGFPNKEVGEMKKSKR